MEKREWTNEDLSNYIQFFPEGQRENVLNEIIESRLMQEYLGTTEGRIILGTVVDQIRDLTMQIVRDANDGFDKHRDDIRQAALMINLNYRFMYKIADIATKGTVHADAMKRVRGK